MVVKALKVAEVFVYTVVPCGVFLGYILISVRIRLQLFFDEVLTLESLSFNNALAELLIEDATSLAFHIDHANMGK